METLRCSACREEKPAAEFLNHRGRSTGKQNQCRSCSHLSGAASYAKHRETTLDYRRRHAAKLRAELIEAYGGACECCGESQPEFLTVDHVNGRKEGERRLTGMKLWAYVRRLGFPRDEFQLLCFNCNCAKGFFGECPHVALRRREAFVVVA